MEIPMNSFKEYIPKGFVAVPIDHFTIRDEIKPGDLFISSKELDPLLGYQPEVLRDKNGKVTEVKYTSKIKEDFMKVPANELLMYLGEEEIPSPTFSKSKMKIHMWLYNDVIFTMDFPMGYAVSFFVVWPEDKAIPAINKMFHSMNREIQICNETFKNKRFNQ